MLETLIGSMLLSLGWAFLLNATLEVMQTGGDFLRLVGYNLQGQFLIFCLNTAVIWMLILLVAAVSGRLWAAFALTTVAALVVGAVDHQKLILRREPVYPSDLDFLRTPGFLVEMAGVRSLIVSALGIVILIAGLLWFGARCARVFHPVRRRATPRAWLGLTALRVSVVVVSLLSIQQLAQFNADGNRAKGLYDAAGAHWAWWSQEVNYMRHGVVAGLLYNLDVPPMERPPGYSEATMARIAAKYVRKADKVNRDRSNTALDDVNVVIVLSEAFSDPTKLKGLRVDGDPIPYTRALMTRTTSGGMLAQLIGGGTANIEYEVLTGLSLSQYQPQLNSPYQMLVRNYSDFPSAVGYFKRHGHTALAIHPYVPEFYHRDQVYPIFGFDRFTFDQKMGSQAKIEDNPNISDAAAFNEVLDQLRGSSQPALVNLVTMQNHYPMSGHYAHPWPVSGVTGGTKDELAGYARGLNYTDGALRDFISSLSSLHEKTVVLFFGDHQPAFWDERTIERNGDPAMKTTPFFIWSTFPTRRVPTPALTSPTQFLPLLLRQLGASEPPFYALLDALRREVPAMEQGVKYDPAGNLIVDADLSPKAQEILEDYRLVLYDLSVGKRYSQASMFYPGP